MDITLSRYAGFCDGVERAFKIAKKIAADPKIKRPIVMLGALVHNDDVVRAIEKLGILKAESKRSLEDVFDHAGKKIGTLVITAHGMGPRIYELAKQKGVDIIDTTCPRVLKVQRLAKVFFDRRHQIVIVGERDHKEVKGIYEWAGGRAKFVENGEDLANLKLDPKKKITLISQTTQNQEFVEKVAGEIRKRYPDVEIVDTVCLTTHNRQEEIRGLARKKEAVVVIGSPTSANSKRLWEISKSLNDRSFFIENASQLRKEWFEGCRAVGVSAGASTPQWVIREVVRKLNQL